jgi:hypothetical protein
MDTYCEKMVITSPSVSSNGKPPAKMYAESFDRQRSGISSSIIEPKPSSFTLIIIMPTCSVEAELELSFVDPVDLADDTVFVRISGWF